VNTAVGAAPGPRYRGRFAPSPTGPLHFGSLVAALASHCDARAHDGAWLVRIEDVDEPRSRAGAEDAILRTLARYGMVSDEPVVRQSARPSLYADALAHLAAQGATFACTCTRRDLEAISVNAAGERVYPGTCRTGSAAAGAHPHAAIRVRVDAADIAFTDLLQGPQRQHLARDVGDFVVRRADGLFAYQLAVVVDDAAQGITTVVRGADLLASTPRQIFLQRVLGVATPRYLHVPVALTARGEKLSKQTHARALPEAPMPALLAAWQFLEQAAPPAAIGSVAEFWQWALGAWSRRALPPVRMLPAPRAFDGAASLAADAGGRV
jgi:glutamyl-Q tRNA(Asp) synthetase